MNRNRRRCGHGWWPVMAAAIVWLTPLASAVAAWGADAAGNSAAAEWIGACPTEPADPRMKMAGMAGNGWDGPGQNAVTIFWRVEGATPDTGANQRMAIINALQPWANVVQIGFVEVPVANENVAIDFNFLTGDHSGAEAQEAGDADCPFNGTPGGVVAHAGFPPGVASLCPNTLAETMAGNVHFDEDEVWEQDDANGGTALSLTLIACHEIGHALGLTHSGGSEVMRPGFSYNDAFVGLTANDITNIQAGYAAGAGSVSTLNTTGVWVDRNYVGVERGTFTEPFNTFVEGAGGVPPASTGVVVTVYAGSYPPPLTISQNMKIQALGGTVTLGQ